MWVWLESFASAVSCPKCSAHWRDAFRLMGKMRRQVTHNRSTFFQFVWRLHNYWNVSLGKQAMSWEDAVHLYQAGRVEHTPGLFDELIKRVIPPTEHRKAGGGGLLMAELELGL